MPVIERDAEVDLFIVLAYETLRVKKGGSGKYEHIHTVWSGFNAAFKKIFEGFDAIAYTNMLEKDGFLKISPAKGGVFLKPLPHFIEVAQEGQEELGLRMLSFLEEVVGLNSKVVNPWRKGNASESLARLGH